MCKEKITSLPFLIFLQRIADSPKGLFAIHCSEVSLVSNLHRSCPPLISLSAVLSFHL